MYKRGMSNEKEIANITKQIVKNYKPEKIILFGSFTSGRPKSSSDVDLLIIKETKKPRVERIKDVLMHVESNLPLEPLVYSPKELNERLALGDFFFQDILEKGKVLYVR
jgi:uncharacterized protein